MALEAGSVFVKLGGLFTRNEFDKWDKAVSAKKAEAKTPINVQLGADKTRLDAALKGSKTELGVWAMTAPKVQLGADLKGFETDLAMARAQVKEWEGTDAMATLGIDTRDALLKYAELDALRKKWSETKVAAEFDIDTKRANAAMAAIESQMVALRTSSPFASLEQQTRQAGVAFDGLAQSAARAGSAISGGGGAGGDGGGGGIRAAAGGFFGGIGRLLHAPGGYRGLGGFSLGSMIGLGPEHLLTAGASLAGSGLNALVGGGGVAATGVAGRLLVGTGANALVSHTLDQNVKPLVAAYGNVEKAVAQYGAKSLQAVVAQRAVNAQMNLLSSQVGPAAAKQIAGLAQNVNSLKDNWQRFTAGAQAADAVIKNQAIGVASAYLPNIGQFTQQNFQIADKTLRPFFDWLKGPSGMGLVKQLEQQFQRNIPNSMGVLTNGFKVFLQVAVDAGKASGGLMAHLNTWLGRLANDPQRISAFVNKELNALHTWATLFKVLFHDIRLAMHASSGEGLKLVGWLTKYLQQLGAWEASAAGSSKIKSFMQSRSDELKQLLSLAVQLGKVFFSFYGSVQPLVPIVTATAGALAKVVGWIVELGKHIPLFNMLFVLPLGAALLSFKLLGKESTLSIGRFLGMGAALDVVKGKASGLVSVLTGGKFGGVASAEKAAIKAGATDAAIATAKAEAGGGLGGLTKSLTGGITGIKGAGIGSEVNPLAVFVLNGLPVSSGIPGGGTLTREEQAAQNAAKLKNVEQGGSGALATAEKGGLLAGLTGLGAKASGLLERGALSLGGGLEAIGLGGAGSSVVAAGGAAAPIAAAAVPVALAGGAGYLGSKMLEQLLGVKGTLANTLTGAGTGAAAGATLGTIGGPLTPLTSSLGALAGGALGGAVGFFTSILGGGGGPSSDQKKLQSFNSTVKSIGTGSKESIAQLKALGDSATYLAGKFPKAADAINAIHGRINALMQTKSEWKKTFDTATSAITKFATGGEKGVKGLFDRFNTNMRLISHSVGLNSSDMSKLFTENLNKMMTSIASDMRTGKISIGDGMRAIHDLAKMESGKMKDSVLANYDLMFGAITDRYRHHKIDLTTANNALNQLAHDKSVQLAADVNAVYKGMFISLSNQEASGNLTHAQYLDKKKALERQQATDITNTNISLVKNVAGLYTGLDAATNAAMGELSKTVNNALKALGVNQVNFSVKGASSSISSAITSVIAASGKVTSSIGGGMTYSGNVGVGGSPVPTHYGGGVLPGSEFGLGDQMTLVDPMGRARAKMAGDELIFNRHQAPELENALAFSKAMGVGSYGSVNELWDGVTRPHGYARGGRLPRYATGGQQIALPLPRGSWYSSSSVDQGVDYPAPAYTPEFAMGAGTIASRGISGFGPWAPILHLDKPIDGYSTIYYGHAGPGVPVGTHVRAGQEIGIVGPGIVGMSTGPHLEVGFGPFPGKGNPSAYAMNALINSLLGGATPAAAQKISAGMGRAGTATGVVAATWKNIKAPKLAGPSGALMSVGQAAIDKVTKAANTFGTSKAASSSSSSVAGSLAGFTSGGGSSQANQTLGHKMMRAFGYPESEWPSLQTLWNHESGWSTTAGSPGAAYGIPQADPGTKMASAGPDWLNNPTTQIKWGLDYIKGRYRLPSVAWAGWYGGNFAGTPYAGKYGYAGGGRLPGFATGGSRINYRPPSRRTLATKTPARLTSVLSAIGAANLPGMGPFNKLAQKFITDDNTAAVLTNRYNQDQQLFSLFDTGSTGRLPSRDLQILAGLQEQEWKLYHDEWTQLPSSIARLRNMADVLIGSPKGKLMSETKVTHPGHKIRPGVYSQAATETVKVPSPGAGIDFILQQLNGDQLEMRNLQNDMFASAQQAAVAQHKISAAAMSSANSLAGRLNTITNQQLNLQLAATQRTYSIAGLTNQMSLTTDPKKFAALQGQIRSSQLNRNGSLASNALAIQMNSLRQAQQAASRKFQKEGFDQAWTAAVRRMQIQKTLNKLQNVTRNLQNLLEAEQRRLAYIVGQGNVGSVTGGGKKGASPLYASSKDPTGGLLQELEYRLSGAPDGSVAPVTSTLETVGYNILDLIQQGAKVPKTTVTEIADLFKSQGISLPVDWSATGLGTAGTASLALQDFMGFQSALASVFQSFGSNFSGRGVNPFASSTGNLAGTKFFGATAATPTAGGGMAAPSSATTNVNITQNFGGGPPDPLTYASGLRNEISALV